MAFNFLKADVFEQKMLSWASVGILVFISAFLWSPSRDGLQGIYYLAFFLPMLYLLISRKPQFHAYGGWMTCSALIYAGFSALSALWGSHPQDIGFFIFQWCVLAIWLCGSSFLFVKQDIYLLKYLHGFLILGALSILAAFIYYYGFVFGKPIPEPRLSGWNVFRNSNEVGAMCGVIALLAFTSALQSGQLIRIYIFYFVVVIAVAGLIASFSRGALVAFVAMSGVALLAIRPPIKIWLPLIIVVVSFFVIFLIKTNVLNSYIRHEQGVGGRSEIWSNVIERLHDNIFIGIGMAKNTNIIVANGNVFNHAHNAWLDTLYRTGLIGLVLVVWHLLTIIKNISRDSRLLSLYLWLGYGCICSLFDSRCFFWEIGAKWFFYWIPIGLIVASIAGISSRTSRTELEK